MLKHLEISIEKKKRWMEDMLEESPEWIKSFLMCFSWMGVSYSSYKQMERIIY